MKASILPKCGFFVTKPITFKALVPVMKTIGEYWFEVVELPES